MHSAGRQVPITREVLLQRKAQETVAQPAPRMPVRRSCDGQ